MARFLAHRHRGRSARHIGNLFYIQATRFGRLDVAALVCSLYPAGTILLAALVLREWPTRRQLPAWPWPWPPWLAQHIAFAAAKRTKACARAQASQFPDSITAAQSNLTKRPPGHYETASLCG
jgi:hypothetical protein